MAALTEHDISILAKINDPEANSAVSRVKTDASLSPDPNLTEDDYRVAKDIETNALKKLVKKDAFGLPLEPSSADLHTLLEDLGTLLDRFPFYSSARNNRVQAIRTLYGDEVLIKSSKASNEAAELILQDMTKAINLLTSSSSNPISPQSARILANLHTQKATLYNSTAKLLSRPDTSLGIKIIETSKDGRELELNMITQFEEQAHYNFLLGAWYGNELAKKMVPVTNPMAKLCGEIVINAMRKELQGYISPNN